MANDAGYAIIPRWMTKDERFTANMILTYVALQSYADESGVAFPSLPKLAARARLGQSTTRAALAKLAAMGVVQKRTRRRDDGGQRSNLYVVLTHDPSRVTPPPGEGAPPARSGREPRQERAPELTTEELTPDELRNGPAATPDQRVFLRDLHIHGGGRTAEEIETWLDGLTVADADAEIREALSAIPRGKGYVGDPEHPGLSEKGREVAARRMIPEET
ncbi:helix-turn-helix DNA binding domain protein [Microbacterium phage Margaery]|uniref:Helix-turn-helix DNA binding domain protein n=1 Tax=Microbacterium phage Margaery TaxID=2591217 RepID=A0A514DHM5_9CAUD|nr:helix-turn-helix DNA binding domain protein [Microbacterium phage Margaery]QDH93109.1 helix-turn-helix DNA binding domain protein [Microbacterium phage Margaery]